MGYMGYVYIYIYKYIIVDMAHMGRYKYGISRDIPPPKLGSNLMISDDIGGRTVSP